MVLMRQTGLTASFAGLRTPIRAAIATLLLASLAACSGGKHQVAVNEAAQYQAHASGNYNVPGDPNDPWGPYISEASKRFDVPERWIREVMRQESGGRMFSNGGLTTSPVGAMGLMQVMPGTYDMLRSQYSLGEDPYDPHNNILAGTAYIRQMYDLYGSPGFLAAYNAGPARVDDYLTRNRPLPAETRHYVASIGPYLRDSFPNNRSQVDQYAMNAAKASYVASAEPEEPASAPVVEQVAAYHPEPVHIAPHVQMAMAEESDEPRRASRGRSAVIVQPTEVAELPDQPRSSRQPYEPLSFTPPSFTPPVHAHGGLHLVSSAMADELPASSRRSFGHNGGEWAVQVGAFDTPKKAQDAASAAKSAMAHGARIVIGSVSQGHSKLYRARLTEMSRQEASDTCARHKNCMVIAPGRS